MTFVVRFTAIAEKFKDEIKLIKKGENSLESGHVCRVDFDGSVGILKGQVLASMKNKKYDVEIYLGKSGEINNCECSCPRGKFQCHHMAALLIYGSRNISSTDSVCSWRAPPTSQPSGSYKKGISELYPGRDYSVCERDTSLDDKERFLNTLKSFNRFSGYVWLLEPEPDPVQPAWVLIRDLLASNSKEDIMKKMEVNETEIRNISYQTVGQRENPLWHQLRFGRVTASNFGAVINATQRKRVPPSLFSQLLGDQNLDGVKSIQWGITHEEVAVKGFEEVTGKKVTPTGLWLHPSGCLGASPDGLIGDDAIIEVKCPFKHRMNAGPELIDRDYCLTSEGVLKKTHPYYHQVQGQIYLTNTGTCVSW